MAVKLQKDVAVKLQEDAAVKLQEDAAVQIQYGIVQLQYVTVWFRDMVV